MRRDVELEGRDGMGWRLQGAHNAQEAKRGDSEARRGDEEAHGAF